jgi:hypothetical protein
VFEALLFRLNREDFVRIGDYVSVLQESKHQNPISTIPEASPPYPPRNIFSCEVRGIRDGPLLVTAPFTVKDGQILIPI